MDKALAAAVENLINNWKNEFPSHPLTVADFKTPQGVMGAMLRVFDSLGIDGDALLMTLPEEECNEHTAYYRDLLPVINMTRGVKHLLTLALQMGAPVTMSHFLQPTVLTTNSVLLLCFNVILFYKNTKEYITPYEEELFARCEQVKILEDKKNSLLELLNEQAEEKGKRAERLEKLDAEIKQLEEELRLEKEAHDEDKQELDTVLKEEHQAEVILEQKKGQRDAIMAEVARKRALRVYDADDIRAQAEQAAQNVKEAEEKLNSLRATLMHKENNLKNLQTIKPSLDTANNLLHEIMKLSECLKDYETGDLDSESKEGELDVLNTELSELQAQLSELRAAREEAALKRQKNQTKRQQERMLAQNALHDAEEKDRKCREKCKLALQRTSEIKEQTAKYESEKTAGMDELASIKKNFTIQLKTMDDALLKMAKDAEENIENKLRSRQM